MVPNKIFQQHYEYKKYIQHADTIPLQLQFSIAPTHYLILDSREDSSGTYPQAQCTCAIIGCSWGSWKTHSTLGCLERNWKIKLKGVNSKALPAASSLEAELAKVG